MLFEAVAQRGEPVLGVFGPLESAVEDRALFGFVAEPSDPTRCRSPCWGQEVGLPAAAAAVDHDHGPARKHVLDHPEQFGVDFDSPSA